MFPLREATRGNPDQDMKSAIAKRSQQRDYNTIPRLERQCFRVRRKVRDSLGASTARMPIRSHVYRRQRVENRRYALHLTVEEMMAGSALERFG